MEIKQPLPVIKGTDPDMEGHIKELQSTLDCHAFGRKRVRTAGVLNLFRKNTSFGETRLKVCDTYLRKASKDGFMPHGGQSMRAC